MASILSEVPVEVDAATAWKALRRVGQPHELFAPVLTAARLDGDVRMVHFANGLKIRERILDVDDARRRVAYTVLDGPGMEYHHASMQIVETAPGHCLFVWITDFTPDGIQSTLAPLIEQGSSALKNTLEATPAPLRAGSCRPVPGTTLQGGSSR